MSSNSAVEEQTLIYRLLHFSKNTSEQQAFVTPKYSITYSQLYELVSKQACLLAELGIDENAIVGIKCPEESKHLILCLACSYIGATSFTIPSYEPKELQQSIKTRCNSTHELDVTHAISVNEVHIEKGKYESQGMQIDSRFLFSSSGTTGEAKLVIHNSSDLVAQAHRHINSSSERFLCLASIEHNFAKRHRLYCLAQGATNIFLNLEEENFIKACKNLEVNVLHVSVFQAQQLLAVPKISELSDIRLKLGGSHAPNSLRQQLKKNITSNLQAGYGTTETGAICFTEVHDQYAGESVGKTLPGIEIRTVSTERKTLPFGEKGELAILCKGMFRGYLNRPDLTSKTLEEDWFYTGDIGYLDAQQRVHLSGRADDMFVFNSINIYPQDIESSLRQFVSVKDAAVIPKESEVHGNIPIALIVFDLDIDIEKDIELEKLQAFARPELGLRCPQQFIVVDEIPRNASGKITREKIKKIIVDKNQIRGVVIQSLIDSNAINNLKIEKVEGFKKCQEDIKFSDIAIDSIVLMNLLVKIETIYGTVISPHQYVKLGTLNDIVDIVLNKKQTTHLIEEKYQLDFNDNGNVQNYSELPYIIKLFRKIFDVCLMVTQFNKALLTIESRLTPKDIECLSDWYEKNYLVPAGKPKQFHLAFREWLFSIKNMMEKSGKDVPENFVFQRVRPNLNFFTNDINSEDKLLIVCFSVAGSRQMAIPNPVLLQHVDSDFSDLLIVGAPNVDGFDSGVPLIGNDVYQVIDYLAKLDFVKHYKSIRTIGCSAGAHMAILYAKRINAEMAVSLGGRFDMEKYPVKILKRLLLMIKGMPKQKDTKMLFIHSITVSRDRIFAKVMRFLSGGTRLAIVNNEERLRHTILDHLLELQQLGFFLNQTIFIDTIEKVMSGNLVLSLPSRKIERTK